MMYHSDIGQHREKVRCTIIYLLVSVIFFVPDSTFAWDKIIKTSVKNRFFDSAYAWVSTNRHKKIKYQLKVKTIGPADGGWSVAHTYIYRTNARQTWLIGIDSIQRQSNEMEEKEGDTGEIEVEFDDWYKIRLEVHADVKEHNPGQGDPEGSFTYSVAKIQFFSTEDGLTEISNGSDSSVKLISPNGGEQLYAGSMTTIRWGIDGQEYISIEYSFNGGSAWNVIDTEVDATESSYKWILPDIESDKCLVRLIVRDDVGYIDQSDSFFTIDSHTYAAETETMKFILLPNHPNPFNPSTTIRYGIPYDCQVQLTIYDILGRKIAVLQDGMINAGFHKVIWNGRNQHGFYVGSGVYIYQLTADEYKTCGKMLFIR